jgi:hypothetical protein
VYDNTDEQLEEEIKCIVETKDAILMPIRIEQNDPLKTKLAVETTVKQACDNGLSESGVNKLVW